MYSFLEHSCLKKNDDDNGKEVDGNIYFEYL